MFSLFPFHLLSNMMFVLVLFKELGTSIPTKFNPIALRKAKIVYNFGLSECKRVKTKMEILQVTRLNNQFRQPF